MNNLIVLHKYIDIIYIIYIYMHHLNVHKRQRNQDFRTNSNDQTSMGSFLTGMLQWFNNFTSLNDDCNDDTDTKRWMNNLNPV